MIILGHYKPEYNLIINCKFKFYKSYEIGINHDTSRYILIFGYGLNPVNFTYLFLPSR